MRDVNTIKEMRDKYLKKCDEIREMILSENRKDMFNSLDLSRLNDLREYYLTKINALNFVLNENVDLYNEQGMMLNANNKEDFKKFIVDYDESKVY